jgi:alpha-beta hydrolase superfamily lysophospholipase
MAPMTLVASEMRTPDGVALRTYQWDPEGHAAATIVLVHGLGEHAGRYAPVAEYFARHSFAVRAYDHRGHGGTGGPLPTFGTLLSDLVMQVKWWAGGERGPLFVLGQSMGGGLVLNLALRESLPLAGVVALSPLLLPTVPPPTWKWLVAVALSRLAPGVTLRSGLSAEDLSHDPQVVRAYRLDPLVHDRVSAVLGRTMLDAGKWALMHAPHLSIPVLLMHGGADRITSAAASRTFAERAGDLCTLKIWDGLYHELHFEAGSEQVLDAIRNWLVIKAGRGDRGSVERPV